MSANISGTRFGGAPGFTPAGTKEPAAGARGEWNGLAVGVSDEPASLIADAAEELTFSASETVEKKLSERKKTDKKSSAAAVKPPGEVLDAIRKRNGEKFAKLLDAVRSGGGNPAAFREVLAGFGFNPSEQHAALLWMEEELADSPSLAALARREREALETEDAAAVQAGYNIDAVETDAMPLRGEGKELYRRTVLGHGGIAAMLAEILQRHGGDDFSEAVEYLRRAVGADLSAAVPSIGKRELEAMNNDLYHLRAIGNFTREFGAELGKIREHAGKPPLPRAGRETIALLCRMKDERLVMLDGLKSILALEGERDATYDAQALGLCRRLIQRLPAKLFADEDSRRRLSEAGQKLLDAAIDLEESLSGDE